MKNRSEKFMLRPNNSHKLEKALRKLNETEMRMPRKPASRTSSVLPGEVRGQTSNILSALNSSSHHLTPTAKKAINTSLIDNYAAFSQLSSPHNNMNMNTNNTFQSIPDLPKPLNIHQIRSKSKNLSNGGKLNKTFSEKTQHLDEFKVAIQGLKGEKEGRSLDHTPARGHPLNIIKKEVNIYIRYNIS